MTIKKLDALQNAANGIGLFIYERVYNDKRKKAKYFAEDLSENVVSPVLDYDKMNHFLLGWRLSLKYIESQKTLQP